MTVGFNPPYKSDGSDDDNREEINLDENEYCGGHDESTKPNDLGYTLSDHSKIGAKFEIICLNPIKGRYVTFYAGHEYNQELCEVEVYAEPS